MTTLTDTTAGRRAARLEMSRMLASDPGHYDDCGEVNATLLGENYAQEHNLYDTDASATIPDWVWDVAAEVAS